MKYPNLFEKGKIDWKHTYSNVYIIEGRIYFGHEAILEKQKLP